ncbi:MAG: flagellar FliJ family protein [Deltaproteobacteria bacterium]|nr:flagellar FliJ family protein [Deltaproteobacteria bacterium]
MPHDALHALVTVRTHKERGAAARVATESAALQRVEAEAREAESVLRAVPAARDGSSDECHLVEAFRERASQALAAARERAVDARRVVEEARQSHAAARLERRVVERVVEHRAEERTLAQRRAEQRQVDELFLLTWKTPACP